MAIKLSQIFKDYNDKDKEDEKQREEAASANKIGRGFLNDVYRAENSEEYAQTVSREAHTSADYRLDNARRRQEQNDRDYAARMDALANMGANTGEVVNIYQNMLRNGGMAQANSNINSTIKSYNRANDSKYGRLSQTGNEDTSRELDAIYQNALRNGGADSARRTIDYTMGSYSASGKVDYSDLLNDDERYQASKIEYDKYSKLGADAYEEIDEILSGRKKSDNDRMNGNKQKYAQAVLKRDYGLSDADAYDVVANWDAYKSGRRMWESQNPTEATQRMIDKYDEASGNIGGVFGRTLEQRNNYAYAQAHANEYNTAKLEEAKRDFAQKGADFELIRTAEASMRRGMEGDEEALADGYAAIQKLHDDYGIDYDEISRVMDLYQNSAELRGELEADTAQMASEHPFLASLGSVGFNPIESGIGVLDKGVSYLTGKPITQNVSTTETIRGQVASDIDNEYGGNIGGIAYQMGMSAADSGYAALMTGAIAGGLGGTAEATQAISKYVMGGIMGVEKANQVANEAIERDLDPDRIMALSAISLATTAVTEGASFERINDVVSKAMTQGIKNNYLNALGQSFLSEGFQEVAEGTLDKIMDTAIAQDKSDIMVKYKTYLDNGSTPEEAIKLVAKDIRNDAITDFIGGGLGGVLIGGSQMAFNSLGTETDMDYEAQQERLARDFANSHEAERFTEALVETTVELYESGEEITEEAYAKALEEKLAKQERELSTPAQNAKDTYIAEEVETIAKARAEDERMVKKLMAESEKREEELAKRDAVVTTEEGEFKVTGFEDRVDGVKIVTEDGQSLTSDEIATDNSRKGQLLGYISKNVESATLAKTMLDSYKGQNLAVYTRLTNLFYEQGVQGLDFDKLISQVGTSLSLMHDKSNAYLKNIYMLGQNAGNAQIDNTVATYNPNVSDEVKSIVNAQNEAISQSAIGDVFRAYTKSTGIGVGYEIDDASASGFLQASLGRIVLSAASPNEWATFIHENAEFIGAFAPEAKQALVKAMLSTMEAYRGSGFVHSKIGEMQQRYRTAGRNAGKNTKLAQEANKTTKEAADEFVNDLFADLFTTEEGIRVFVEHTFNDKSLSDGEKKSALDTFKAFLDKIVNMISNFVKGKGFKYDEIKGLSLEDATKLRNAFLDALDIAQERYSEKKEAYENSKNQNKPNEKTQNPVPFTQILEQTSESDKFSVDKPVEKTDKLIAVHNLNAKSLLKTLMLEGIPAPSIALVLARDGWTEYGDISVLFYRDTVDPKKNNRNYIFPTDGYTPMFPKVRVKLDEAIVDRLKSVMRSMDAPTWAKDDAYKFIESLAEKIEYYGVEDAIERAKSDYGIKALYLSEKGISVEKQTKEEKIGLSEQQKDNAQFYIDNVGFFPVTTIDEDATNGNMQKVLEYAFRDRENFTFNSESRFQKIKYEHILMDAALLDANGGVSTNVVEDVDAEHSFIDGQISEDEYLKWIHDTFDGIVEKEGIHNGKDIFTPSGKRRTFEQLYIPVTAENVVKSMLSQADDHVNGTGSFLGINSVMSRALGKFKSIEDVKKSSSKLQKVDKAEYDAMVSELNKRLANVIREIANASNSTDWMAVDSIGNDIKEASIIPTAENIKKVLEKYHWKVTDAQCEEIVNIINDSAAMPRAMFEAKPMRVVGFDEIASVVLPTGTDKELIDRLDELEIPYVEYESESEEDRLAKVNEVNEVEDIAFSIDNVSAFENSTKSSAEVVYDEYAPKEEDYPEATLGELLAYDSALMASINVFAKTDIFFVIDNLLRSKKNYIKNGVSDRKISQINRQIKKAFDKMMDAINKSIESLGSPVGFKAKQIASKKVYSGTFNWHRLDYFGADGLYVPNGDILYEDELDEVEADIFRQLSDANKANGYVFDTNTALCEVSYSYNHVFSFVQTGLYEAVLVSVKTLSSADFEIKKGNDTIYEQENRSGNENSSENEGFEFHSEGFGTINADESFIEGIRGATENDRGRETSKSKRNGKNSTKVIEKVSQRNDVSTRVASNGETGNIDSQEDTRYSIDSQGRELSEGQTEYFKDSMARDSEGRLLTMYHGTAEGGFTVFNPNQSYTVDRPSIGMWFAPSKDVADRFTGNREKSSVYEVYLNVKNPLVIDAKGKAWNGIPLPNELQGKGINRYRNARTWEMVESAEASTEQIAKYARKNGYDGVIFRNVQEVSSDEDGILTDSYVVFEPEQIKNVDNLNPTSDPDIRYSIDSPDFGYHAGDLGKSEDLWNMTSTRRETGHFGTGTYFVGDEQKISDGTYGKRPHETVDFSEYHLFRPSGYKSGIRLHEALKYINQNIYTIKDGATTFDERWQIKKDIENAGDILTDYFGEYSEEEKREALETLRWYAEKYGKYIKDFEDVEEWDDEDVKSFSYYADDIYEYLVNKNDGLRNALSDIAMSLIGEDTAYGKISPLDSIELLTDLVSRIQDDVEAIGDPYNSRGTDSPSTMLMKALGYEGIDVRGIEGLDNTSYGSVIYDLKGEDLARKQEIGTARYSIDDPFMEAFEEIDQSVKAEEEAIYKMIEQGLQMGNMRSDFKVTEIAKRIKKMYGSKIKTSELVKDLQAVFTYLAETGDIRMDDVMRVMREIAMPIIDAIPATVDEAAQREFDNIKSYLKGQKITLNSYQLAEVTKLYGSLYEFRRRMSGIVSVVKEGGRNLDDFWSELVETSGYGLKADENSTNMPVALLQYMEGLKPKATVLEDQSYEAVAQDVALEIFRSFFIEQSRVDVAEDMKNQMLKRNEEAKKRYQAKVVELTKQVEAERAEAKKNLENRIEELTMQMQSATSGENADDVEAAQIKNERDELVKRYAQLEEQYKKVKAESEAQKRANQELKNRKTNERIKNQLTPLKERLTREVKSLQNMLLHPTKSASKHIPPELVNAVIDMLNAIDISNPNNKAVSERLKKMAEIYERYHQDKTFTFDYDKNIADDIKELEEIFKNGGYRLLGVNDLQRVIDIVTALKTQIRNANNLIIEGKRIDSQAVASGSAEEIVEAAKNLNPITKPLEKYASTMLNAKRYFRRLSGYVDNSQFMKLFDSFNEGSMRQMQIQKDLGEMWSSVLEGRENQKAIKKFISTKESDLVDVGLKDANGNPVLVTRAMRMSLIMHTMNSQNLEHILGNGVRIPNLKYLKSGNLNEAYDVGEIYTFISREQYLELIQSKNYAELDKLKMELTKQLKALEGDLSDWEVKFLEVAKEFFHEKTGDYINQASIELKGYAIARVQNYFPIKVDPHYTGREWSGLVMDGTLEGMGMLKERVNSRKAIYLEDITNVIQRQISNVSAYAGLAIPIRNFNMAKNIVITESNKDVKFKNLDDVIAGTFGTKWLENLMADLQGGRSNGRDFMMKLRSNFAGATLTLNPSVAIKQAASYPTAAAVVGWKALNRALLDIPKGFITQKGLPELEEINPLLWYRNQGNGTQDLADAKSSELIKSLPVGLQKALNWTQFMDSGTVRTLEYAAKYYVDDNFKDLEKGSEEYWKKVSEVFTRVVQETQPNYSTLEKADIIRNPHQLLKMLVMFKTQPFQNFSIMYDALGELGAVHARYKANPNAETKARLKESELNAARAITSQLTSATVFSLMTILAQSILHRWWKFKDDDDELDFQKVLSMFGTGVLSSLAGAFLGGAEIYEIIKAYVTNEKYYGVEISSVEMFNDLANSGISLKDAIVKYSEANTSADREKALQKIVKNIDSIVGSVGEVTGVPINNVKNILYSAFYYISDVVEAIDKIPENGGFKLNFSSKSNPINEWKIDTQYERLYKAFKDGDTDAYTKYFNEKVVDSGKSEEEVRKDVASRLATLIGEDYVSGVLTEEEAISYLEQDGYDEMKAYNKIGEWESDYSGDYARMDNELSKAIENPNESRSSMVDAVAKMVEYGKKKNNIRDNIKNKFSDDYRQAYASGNAADMHSVLRQALITAGYTETEANDILKSWLE